jgi:hypothetical protein
VLIERATTRRADKRRPSQRVRDILSSFIQALDDEDDPDVEDDEVLCNAIENCIDPQNYSAAMKTAVAERWKTGIEDELKSLRDNRTWVVVEKPPDVKPLACRFVSS